jgi:hypothetical protein
MKEKDRHPARKAGIFFIVLGLMMFVIIFDFLHLGSPRDYFVWQMLLISIGLIAFFNRNPIGGVILVSVGIYFMLPELDHTLPFLGNHPIFLDEIYWPITICIVGVVLIISGIIKKNRNYK